MDGENIMENPMNQWDDLGGFSTPIFGRPPILQQLHPQTNKSGFNSSRGSGQWRNAFFESNRTEDRKTFRQNGLVNEKFEKTKVLGCPVGS